MPGPSCSSQPPAHPGPALTSPSRPSVDHAEQGEGVMSGPLCEHISVWGCLPQGLSPWSQQMLGIQALSAVWVPREFSSVHLPCQHLMFLPNSESLLTSGGQLAAPGLPAPGISTRDISPFPQPLGWGKTFRDCPPASCLWVWEEISRVEPSPSSSAPEAWQ